jgi:hypothetical protein
MLHSGNLYESQTPDLKKNYPSQSTGGKSTYPNSLLSPMKSVKRSIPDLFQYPLELTTNIFENAYNSKQTFSAAALYLNGNKGMK